MRKCRKKLFEQILFVFENICDRLLKKAMKAKKNPKFDKPIPVIWSLSGTASEGEYTYKKYIFIL